VERVWITAEDYRRLYAVAKPRERVMLALGATMGLRREEIMTLTLGQLRDGGIEIHGKGHGPDGRVEWRPMSDGVKRALEEWAPERERLVRKYGTGCDRLVVSRTGEAMDKGTMDWIMRQLGRRAGVKATPHSLRRLFATTMNDSGVDLETMARMMRHTSPTTTMAYYLKADPRRMASATEAVDSVLTVRRTPNKYYI
jgi:integrase/recombinase XerD